MTQIASTRGDGHVWCTVLGGILSLMLLGTIVAALVIAQRPKPAAFYLATGTNSVYSVRQDNGDVLWEDHFTLAHSRQLLKMQPIMATQGVLVIMTYAHYSYTWGMSPEAISEPPNHWLGYSFTVPSGFTEWGLDAASGQKLWQITPDAATFASSFVAADKLVEIYSDHYQPQSEVFHVTMVSRDVRTGGIRWRIVQNYSAGWRGFYNDAFSAVDAHAIFVGEIPDLQTITTGLFSSITESFHATVAAFDGRTGKQQWSAPLPATYTMALAQSGDMVYVRSRGYITALRTSDGSRAWQAPITDMADDCLDGYEQPCAAPLIAGNVVLYNSLRLDRDLFAGTAVVYARDRFTGALLWQRTILTFNTTKMAIVLPYITANTGFYFDNPPSSNPASSQLVAINLQDGTTHWQSDVPANTSVQFTPQRLLSFTTGRPEDPFYSVVSARDLDTQQVQWTDTITERAGIAINEQGLFYVNATSMQLLDPATGRVRWRSPITYPDVLTMVADTR